MSTNRRRTPQTPSRSLRRRVLGLVIATAAVASGFAAVAPAAAQAAPHQAPADTSTWG